jgi:hypothetical protein
MKIVQNMIVEDNAKEKEKMIDIHQNQNLIK